MMPTALALCGGGLLAFGLRLDGCGPLVVIGLAAWLSALRDRPSAQAAWLGLCGAIAWKLPLLLGLGGAARLTLELSPVASVGLVASLLGLAALPWVAFGVLSAGLERRLGRASGPLLPLTFLLCERAGRTLAAEFALGELATAWISTGAPRIWAACGGGPALGTAAFVLTAWALSEARHEGRWELGPALLAGVLGAVLTAPSPTRSAPAPRRLRALVVAPSITRGARQAPALQRTVLSRYLRASRRALRQLSAPVDLVVWPEGSSSRDLASEPALRRQLASGLQVGDHRPSLLLGCERAGSRGRLNGAFLLTPAGGIAGSYARRRLLPFGEYAPPLLGDLFTRRGLRRPYHPGAAEQPPLQVPLADGTRAALRVVICGEGLQPEACAAIGADALVVLANDDVFPSASTMPAGLLRETATRALELGLPVLRASHAGPSGWATPSGVLRLLPGGGALELPLRVAAATHG